MPNKISQEEYIRRCREIHGDKYDYSKTTYLSMTAPVTIICPKHGPFTQRAAEHLKYGCKQCGVESRSILNSITYDEFIRRAREIHGDKYDYSLSEKEYTPGVYKGGKITIICPEHGPFRQRPGNHIRQEQGCPKCGRKKVEEAKRFTREEYIRRARQIHGWKYDYSKADFNSPDNMITIICPKHGEFRQNKYNHINAGQGCPKCAKEQLTTGHETSFLQRAATKFGDRFDYSRVVFGKTEPDRKITVVCRKHGPFRVTTNNHLRTSFGGCRECELEERTVKFLRDARIVHGDKYDYSRVNFKNNNQKVEIICPVHGPFFQTPDSHRNGKGCRQCAIEYNAENRKLTRDEFIRRASENLGPYVDFSDTVYNGLRNDVTVRCTKHGPFTKQANLILHGAGCPKCAYENKNFINRLLADEEFLMTVPSNSLLELIGHKHNIPKALRNVIYTQSRSEERSNAIRNLREAVTDTGNALLQNAAIEDETLDSIEVPLSEQQDFVTTETALDAIEALGRRKRNDGEITEFIRQEYLQALWNDILNATVRPQDIKTKTGSTGITERLFSEFLTEYARVDSLDTDPAYRFPSQPTLLQKLIVTRSLERKYYANWSAMGTGKTLAALLTARLSGAGTMLVLAPKDVLIHSWSEQIQRAYPDTETFTSVNEIPGAKPLKQLTRKETTKGTFTCILINYDRFSIPNGYESLRDTLLNAAPDFVCLDEIQYIKSTTMSETSNRHVFCADFLRKLRKRNPEVRVQVLSGTPVINDLEEPRSILSILTGKEYERNNRVTVRNVHETYKNILSNGFRYLGNPNENVETNLPEIDGSSLTGDIASTDPKDGILALEQLLTKKKLQSSAFLSSLKKGTIIFTHYVDGIVEPTLAAVTSTGLSAEAYTGDTADRAGVFKRFVNGETDVLVASRPVILGVDGLQETSDNLIILSLPWTWADYMQLIARINRPRKDGKKRKVTVTIPQIVIRTKNGTWSWDKRRNTVIRNKRTLGEAIVDGHIEKIYNIDRQALLQETMEEFKKEVTSTRPENTRQTIPGNNRPEPLNL